MKEIDMNTWKRKEIYDFFSKISNPFYMISFTIDVTEIKMFTKRNNCSFYYALIFLCTKAMSCIENFQYVCIDNKVYLIDERIPSFTDRKHDSEYFHITNVPTGNDIIEFCKRAREISGKQESFIDLSQENNNLVYFSCFPTLRLTALTNEFDILNSNHPSDNVPRIAWGKYENRNDRLELTISLEVNHRFIDGVHIEKFYAELTKMIENLSK